MNEFRRSKILYTGTSSSSVKRRKFPLRKAGRLIVFVALFLLVAAGSFYMMRWERLLIRTIDIKGLSSLSEEEIRNTVAGQLEGNTFFFTPRSHVFVVSGSRLEQELRDKYPKIFSAEVKKTLKSSLEVIVQEREIWGIACTKTEVAEIQSGVSEKNETRKTAGPCFYIDRSGFAFEEVSSFEGGVFPVLYKGGEGVLGSLPVSQTEVEGFEKINEALASINLSLLSIEFLEESEDVRLMLKDGWALLIPFNKNPTEWAPVLRALLLGEIKERKSELDYVDLRFGNKVFYKFR
ncbi:MAG: FtsQ-type POTRA domain-containing protein [Candidatus Sungbacteria bacterium]|nr:FtsQ-type POTRA domain-containing protein [Candidatus Sungbacteria bacterium]